MAWSRAFQKYIIFHFLTNFFLHTFLLYNAIKNSIFANLQFFSDSKSRAQELSNDVSFVKFGHQTWDLEGGGQIDPPPQRILVFKYPSRDRVNNIFHLQIQNVYV